jgi:hypothetical protein
MIIIVDEFAVIAALKSCETFGYTLARISAAVLDAHLQRTLHIG